MSAREPTVAGVEVEPETGAEFPVLRPGQRVRLRPPLVELELATLEGTVLGPAEYAGHYRIRLDAPARYHEHGVGSGGPVREIVEVTETSDNVDVWDGERWLAPAWTSEEAPAAEGDQPTGRD